MKRTLIALAMFASLSVLAVGCGGGGSGDSTSSTTGSGSGGGGGSGSTQATVSQNNAARVVMSGEMAAGLNGGMNDYSTSFAKAVDGAGDLPLAMPASYAVADVLLSADTDAAFAKTFALTVGGTKNGSSSGTATYSGTVNLDGTKNLTVTFANYNNGGETVNGQLTIVNTQAAPNYSYTFTLTNLSVKENAVNYTVTVNGTITMTGTAAATTFTSNIALSDGTNSFALSNFAVASTISGSTVTYTLNGTATFNNKSASITNLTPIVITNVNTDDHPSSGSYVIDGNGKAKVTYVDINTVKVEVDANEDGTYEYSTGNMTWSQMEALALSQSM